MTATVSVEEETRATRNLSITSNVSVDIVVDASRVEVNHNFGRYYVQQNMKDSGEESVDEMETYNTVRRILWFGRF